jgi:hypothetical protein
VVRQGWPELVEGSDCVETLDEIGAHHERMNDQIPFVLSL